MIRPAARRTPVRIPLRDEGSRILRISCHFVAPRPRAPFRYPSGTARSASCVFLTIKGITISVRVSTPFNRENPSPATCPKNTIPNNPKITEGIPASVSMANVSSRTAHPGCAYSLR